MIAEEAARYLETEGIGDLGTLIFVGPSPDKPSRALSLEDETAPVLPEGNAYRVDQFGLGVTMRSDDYSDARDTIKSVHKKLTGFSGTFIPGGAVVTLVHVDQVPAWIGQDEDRRSEFTSHYVVRVQSTGDDHRTDI